MALQIAPTLPPAPPPKTGAPPAERDEDGGFARMLHGEKAADERAEAPADTGEVDGQEATDKLARDTAYGDGGATLDPTMAHWLAGLHLPPAAEAKPEQGAARGQGAEGEAGEGDVLSALGKGTRPAGLRALADRNAADTRHDAAEAGSAKVDARQADQRESRFSLEGLDSREAAQPLKHTGESASRSASFELPAASTIAAPTTPVATTSTAGAHGVADVALPYGPQDAGFGDAFATQVSVLARDGVQQAELHLNPAETGPVSIQIVLEGTQARIEFGADAQPTRTAIEQSLPELAAALSAQGLTLAGGGVSEHAQGRRQANPDAETGSTSRRTGGSGAVEAPATRTVRVARSAGGLDLYA